ncbi:MAG: hypothetical protein NTY64_16975, partial [Deltaproteobacteria bacterium]|nr:hypothetical protein [Deltaproteobacteria bacterium]
HSLCFMTVGKNAVSYRIPPLRSITYCLRAAGIGLDDLALIVADQPLLPLSEGFLNDFLPIQDKSKIRRLPHPSHHLAHAYSTYFCSPFQESAILIADAFGSELILGNEGESGYVARGNDVRMVFRTYQDSLPRKVRPGRSSYALTVMYRLITQALGFVLPYGSWRPEAYFDEAGKTMGLAPYGRLVKSWPSLVEPANGTYRTDRFTRWIQDQKIGRMERGELVAIIREHSQKLSRFHKDLAYKAQMELEQGLLLLAQKLHDETKCENLCLAGGAGLNCVANRKIFDHTPFKHIFVQPASTDDGNAIGCALYGWHKIIDREKRFVLRN